MRARRLGARETRNPDHNRQKIPARKGQAMPIVRRKKTGGRRSDPVLDAYALRYGLTPKQRKLLARYVVQVSLCRSEESRRLIIGVSR